MKSVRSELILPLVLSSNIFLVVSNHRPGRWISDNVKPHGYKMLHSSTASHLREGFTRILTEQIDPDPHLPNGWREK